MLNITLASIQSSVSSAFASANRGPLTTIFTPPASCLSDTTLVSYLTTTSASSSSAAGSASTSSVSPSGFTTTKIFINHYSWGDPACYPSTIATIDGSTRWNNGYYYSPGICPSGWTSACTQRTNAFGFSTTIQSETTAVMCCPSNWDCVGGSTVLTGHGCSTSLFVGQTLTNVWQAPAPTPQAPMSLPAERNLTSWVVPANTSALCDAIPILWQNTDIQILSLLGETITSSILTTSSTNLTSSTLPTATSTSSFSSTPTSSPSDLPSGISTGAKAAIGITIPIFFFALILGIFFFFRRRNRSQNPHHELPASTYGGHELPDGTDWGQKQDWKMSELHGQGRVEADADHGIFEAHSGAVYEMDSSPRIGTPKSAYSDVKPGTADPLLPKNEMKDKTPISKFNPRTPPPVYPK